MVNWVEDLFWGIVVVHGDDLQCNICNLFLFVLFVVFVNQGSFGFYCDILQCNICNFFFFCLFVLFYSSFLLIRGVLRFYCDILQLILRFWFAQKIFRYHMNALIHNVLCYPLSDNIKLYFRWLNSYSNKSDHLFVNNCLQVDW